MPLLLRQILDRHRPAAASSRPAGSGTAGPPPATPECTPAPRSPESSVRSMCRLPISSPFSSPSSCWILAPGSAPSRWRSPAPTARAPACCVAARIASSTARPLRRSSRGLQSSVRSESRIAPADPELRIALELHLLAVIELREGVDQPHHPGRDQVVQLHMLRQPLMDAARQIAHRRQMLQQQALALRRRELRAVLLLPQPLLGTGEGGCGGLELGQCVGRGGQRELGQALKIIQS